MSIDPTVLMIVLGGAIVTLIPRILPFILVRNVQLPQPVLKWLSYIPICIFTALVVQSFIVKQETGIAIDWHVLLVIVPTVLTAVLTKSLSITVIAGVVLMACMRALS